MKSTTFDRRRFLRKLGVSTAALPFLSRLPSAYADAADSLPTPKRLVIVFTPNGTLPDEFWPKQFGDDQPLDLGSLLDPLNPLREQILMLKGVNNMVKGDGDSHMRGMSCLLTGTELNPGNIMGGGATPAGWASGLSIDQEMRNFLQSDEETRTRFGSLEFGVAVPKRADPWTRMCYAGNNKPVAPVDDPGQMLERIYGDSQGQQRIVSVLDYVRDDLQRVLPKLSTEDRHLLEEHLEQVHQLEQDIAAAAQQQDNTHPEPDIDPEIELINDNTPEISRMQIDLLVSALANDMTRVASLQYMRSVGQARMRWLNIQEGHHSLSHEPDNNKDAHDKLKRINSWFASEIAYLADQLASTPEPGGRDGSMLDNTQIVWVNELGKGNTHTLKDIPLLLIGGGAGFKTNRALDLEGVPHNRFWLSVAQGLGHKNLDTFGTKKLCNEGPLLLS